MKMVLEVGELGVASQKGETITIHSLGSCIAVIMLHQQTGAVGMAHVALPDSCIDPCLSQEKPGYFANTAIPHLFEEMKKLGEKKNNEVHAGSKKKKNGSVNKMDIRVKLVGGSAIMDPNNTFNIGMRNLTAIKKLLQELGLRYSDEDIGGTISRTVTISVGTEKVLLSSPGEEDWEI